MQLFGKQKMYKSQRRKINTEEKAKVVAAVWETELIQFLAVLAVMHQDGMKKRIILAPGRYEEKD